ncbi:MAG TPA: hypothetical protein VF017_23450 [Thermoanaerobaculia bacterium]|nr:hypothetical protein [Thermoanaerobaculia bacterium]
MDIAVWYELQGLSPDEIVSAQPTLSLADLYAADPEATVLRSSPGPSD